jgi:hypothetical protein
MDGSEELQYSCTVTSRDGIASLIYTQGLRKCDETSPDRNPPSSLLSRDHKLHNIVSCCAFLKTVEQNTIGEELLFEGEQHKQSGFIDDRYKSQETRGTWKPYQTRNQGSKILRQEGQTRNSNTPLPPAKGQIKSKPGIRAKREQNVQFAN